MTNAFDPRKHIEDLRNHLAGTQTKLSFLFGAGTSCSVNTAPLPAPGKRRGYTPLIPAVAKLTEDCRTVVAAASPKFDTAWDLAKAELAGRAPWPNIEDILSLVRKKIDAVGPKDVLLGLSDGELRDFAKAIQKSIAQAVTPDPARFPPKLPHDGFSSWVKNATRHKPIEIFTSNYDLLLEQSFDRLRVPSFDGFVGSLKPFFRPDFVERDDLLPGPSLVRLWKIHGSINWELSNESSEIRIIRHDSPNGSGMLILPSHLKYEESRKQPYLTYLERLRNQLDNDDSVLIALGYSFGDQHINSILFDVLDGRTRAHVIALMYDNLSACPSLVTTAKRTPNLVVYARDGAVIGGLIGTWKAIEPVDDYTASFMDIAFDSNAVEDDLEQSKSGMFRLGDFFWFCQFLEAMK